MPVPTTFADLSTTPASNSPAGSENVFPSLDDYIRFINAALASIKANTATNGWVSPYIAGTGSWAIPGTIGSTTPNTGAFTTLSSSGLTTANSLTVTNASTFTGVATFTGTPTGAGLTARFATPGPIGSGTASTGAFTTVNASGTITGATFSGSGASLTSIPAGQLTGDVAQARLATALNAGGSAPIYAPRAWVNFNGTGTVAIRASGNVSSITDNGTGDYTINFTTALPDADYGVSIGFADTQSGSSLSRVRGTSGGGATLKSTSQLRISCGGYEISSIDFAELSVLILR